MLLPLVDAEPPPLTVSGNASAALNTDTSPSVGTSFITAMSSFAPPSAVFSVSVISAAGVSALGVCAVSSFAFGTAVCFGAVLFAIGFSS